jgi:hypothetical protein
MNEIDDLLRRVARLEAMDRQVFVPLAAPLTSTAWDGDGYSTTAKTKIDLSAVFGAPAGITAVLFKCRVNDSASATNDCLLILSPNDTADSGPSVGASGIANDKYGRGALLVPCDASGDIYYQIAASGSGTFDVFMEIWGYFR